MQEVYLSVIIPLYNKENDVKDTILSVLNQDYQKFEIVVIDDGSTDNSVAVVRKIKDERIRILRFENKGLSASRNRGVKNAYYDYIAFLDADDTWRENHLSTFNFLINKYSSSASWFGTSYDIVQKNGKVLNSVLYNYWEDDWHGLINNFFQINRRQWLVNMCTICVNKAHYEQIQGFDESLDCEEDIDFFIRMGLHSPIAYCNRVTMSYNTLGGNRISDASYRNKQTINLQKYSTIEQERQDVKQFLDFFRYTQYVKFMLSKDFDKAYKARKGINRNNLTALQFCIIHLPRFIIVFGMLIKQVFSNLNIDLRVTK
jgi:glycosyltransferase involved in cell wall biosynthesis